MFRKTKKICLYVKLLFVSIINTNSVLVLVTKVNTKCFWFLSPQCATRPPNLNVIKRILSAYLSKRRCIKLTSLLLQNLEPYLTVTIALPSMCIIDLVSMRGRVDFIFVNEGFFLINMIFKLQM